MMRNKKQRLPAEERKKLILKSAVSVFAQSNYNNAKMADIAAEAGVSEAMIYKYFPSKKAIFLKILQHMSGRIVTFWKEEAEKTSDALTILKNMGLTYLKRMKQHPHELKVQFQAISEIDDKDIAKQLRQDHRNYISFINNIFKKGIEQGTIKPDIPTEKLAFIYNGAGIVLNMMKLLSFERELTENTISEFINSFVDYIKVG